MSKENGRYETHWSRMRAAECEVGGCGNTATYEGWYRVRDFTRNPTGLVQKRQVCSVHKYCLIGAEKEREERRKEWEL